MSTVALGFFAGALYIAAHYMKTMVPLRLTEIASNVLFVVYGAMYPSWPTLVLYGLLIPLNGLRLYEMLELIKKVREAAQARSVDRLAQAVHAQGNLHQGLYPVPQGRAGGGNVLHRERHAAT